MTSTSAAPSFPGDEQQPNEEATIPDTTELPDGIGWRPAQRADVAALTELVRAEELASTGESSISEAEIAQWFDSARQSERSVTRVLDREGVLVGLWRAYRNFDDKYSLDVAIDRTLPGELVDELWRAGLDWLERLVLNLADGRGVASPRAELWVFEGNALALRHATAAGFQNVRTFIEMQIDLANYTGPSIDPRVRVRPADISGDDGPDMRAMYDVITNSFQDHFDFTLRPFPEWVQMRRDDSLADFTHWYLAEVEGKAVGALMGHNTYVEIDDAGYVAVLGVLREGRGKGVAKSLLHTSFARYANEGRACVKLHVDADSPTGATHLYESVGMYRRLVGFDFHKHLGARPLISAAQTVQEPRHAGSLQTGPQISFDQA